MAIVLVTGCSSGFGEAIARGFAARGDIVYASMRRPEDATAALRDTTGVRVIALDVVDPQARRAAVDSIVAAHGRLDVLVNNAGVAVFGSIEDTPEATTRLVFETNFFAPLELMRYATPVMRRQGAGRIVNISAVGAVLSTPLLSIYAATKHALDAATAALDIETRPFGMRAISILPGQFRTEIGSKSPGRHISGHYAGIAATMDAWRAAHAADQLADLSPVVDATLAAAHDSDPPCRFVVGVGLADRIKAATAELDALQDFEARRAGVI